MLRKKMCGIDMIVPRSFSNNKQEKGECWSRKVIWEGNRRGWEKRTLQKIKVLWMEEMWYVPAFVRNNAQEGARECQSKNPHFPAIRRECGSFRTGSEPVRILQEYAGTYHVCLPSPPSSSHPPTHLYPPRGGYEGIVYHPTATHKFVNLFFISPILPPKNISSLVIPHHTLLHPKFVFILVYFIE